MGPVISWCILFLVITLTALAQVCLRADNRADFQTVFPLKFIGLGMLGLVSILMVVALQGLPLKIVMAWSGLTFVLVPLAARLFLKERLTRQTVLASIMILVGIAVFSAAG